MSIMSQNSAILVKLNGNKLRIPIEETLATFIKKRIKLQKVRELLLNDTVVPFDTLNQELSDGDEVIVRLKTKEDFSGERVGLRTGLRYLIVKWFSVIKWRATRIFSGGVISREQNAGGKHIKFLANSRKAIYRSNFSDKEPDLISWLDRIGPEDILLDIGANVGAVSLYAAVGRGCRVISCEPNGRNFEILIEHLYLNNLTASVCPLNVAVSDKSSVSTLFVKNPESGASGNSFSKPIDQAGRLYRPLAEQSCLGITVDEIFSLVGSWAPNYLKLDVDGFEDLVLRGAPDTLRRRLFKSICVEIDLLRPQAKDSIIHLLRSYGYTLQQVGGQKIQSEDVLPDEGRAFNFIFDRL